MSMNESQAQTAVSISALIVAGTYGYRRLVEPQKGTAPPTAHFVIGFGFTYIVLAVIAEAAPPVGGMFAILIAVGDFLANGASLLSDLTGTLAGKTTPTKATATGPAAAGSSAATGIGTAAAGQSVSFPISPSTNP